MTKILIVDDNEQNLYMLSVLLQGSGYQVETAANGEEALSKARAEHPDIIISDILMPVMDGFTLCGEWKKDNALNTIPFIFYTATYTDPKDEEFALSLGAERFIVKPLDPDVFIGILRDVIKEVETGRLIKSKEVIPEESVYLKEYNERLVKKLEDKMLQLKEANRTLERDITERKRAEEALKKSEEEARQLVQENTIMAEIGLIISSTLNIEEVYERFAEEVHKLISFDRISINIVNPEGGTGYHRLYLWS